MVSRNLRRLMKRKTPLNFNRATVRSNFSAAKRGAEEIQDEFQATKVNRVQQGSGRKRLVPLYGLRPESKFTYLFSSLSALASGTPQIIDLVNMTRGTDNEASRIGDKINVKSILSRIVVSWPTAGPLGESGIVRLMLIYDRQPNGLGLDITKLFENPVRALSPLNSDNAGRYKVIWDKIIPLTADTSNAQQLITQNNIFKLGLRVNYDGNAGDITDIERGNISLVLLYNSTNTVTTAPSFLYDIKVTYQDI